jgi:protein gp37
MADGTQIEWTSATWNPITGCMVKSPGCIHCYAQLLAGTRMKHHPSRANLTREVNGHHVWTGEVRFNEQWLDQPLRWTKPRDIFVVAHGDLAYEKVPNEWLDKVFGVMSLAVWHRYQVLTKRPDRLAQYVMTNSGMVRDICYRPERYFSPGLDATVGKIGAWPARYPGWPMSHVWIGCSVERQQEADERRPHLEALARMGWNTWVSYEPALGPVDWSGWEFVKWMVSGGESDHGGNARPSHPDWHRATRDWCAANSIPYFFKQHGDWASNPGTHPLHGGATPEDRSKFESVTWPDGTIVNRVGKARAGALLDGVEHRAMPR